MRYLRLPLLLALSLIMGDNAWAVDSYRYLHVTIETPWLIFVFLFFLVTAPITLSVIIYWRHAMKRSEEEKDEEASE